VNGSYDAVVIGAGPAGSAAAIELARRGHAVALLERDHFPRPKACGEFLSPDALPTLERWGLRSLLEEAGAETIRAGAFCFGTQPPIEFELPRPALGVSRFLLDDLLARRSAGAGARVFFGANADAVEPAGKRPEEGFTVSGAAGGKRFQLSSRIVVAAWGRSSPLDRAFGRPFAARTSGRFLGWSRHYAGSSARLARRVELHFFRGGYAGLSRVEGQAVNFAGIVSESELRRSGPGWETFTGDLLRREKGLAAALSGLSPAGDFRGTSAMVFERRAPVFGRLLAAGDVAGLRDPFTGSGQSSALSAGILAAEAASEFLRGETDFDRMCRRYRSRWRSRLGRAFSWDAVFRAALSNGPLRRLLPRLAPLIPLGFELTRPRPR
jgi:flavin-dependent dehydrogenase